MPENSSTDDVGALADLVKEWLVAEQDVRAAELTRARTVQALTEWTRANVDELNPAGGAA